jgi:hypothetical protein
MSRWVWLSKTGTASGSGGGGNSPERRPFFDRRDSDGVVDM